MMRYYRKIIKITGHDSPNVRYGKAQLAAGIEPTDEIIIPGVLSYSEYCKRMELWDPIRKCISIDAEFYEGEDALLFPPLWLNAAELRRATGPARTMGVDSALGGDNTSWAVASDSGILHLESRKTPDTSVIPSITLGIMSRFGIRAENVLFDYGGGGKVHVDRLRTMGHKVRAILFGSPATAEKRRGLKPLEQRNRDDEVRMVYKNRRAEIYGTVRERLDPKALTTPFAIPSEIANKPRLDGGPSLRGQMAPIPLWFDEEGRMYLPPKHKKPDAVNKTDSKINLVDLIGCSPDELEAVCLAVFGLSGRTSRSTAGAIV
jgi:hypothetical protein